jgi:hypothetical protein
MIDNNDQFDWRRVPITWSGKRVTVVTLSLPVISDDGMRGLIYTIGSRGSFDGAGARYVFEMVDGRWMMRERFGVWIS